ncbi:hypothetical protein CKO_00977 [Citrobacter koseri ATCC BAA-895]|uniref:Uncharacterized protein n=1 Tax=Citrobacter koseri (strain ATCC BAA-895 / CDC 4225-83 / SGSC4696) TaxID=290338 RepID=A8AF61_CITK8|nr:hypothetical protein CKO_00977 [Citrobacter koseri ATCC BAA-895]
MWRLFSSLCYLPWCLALSGAAATVHVIPRFKRKEKLWLEFRATACSTFNWRVRRRFPLRC